MIILLSVGALLIVLSLIARKKLHPCWGFLLVFLIMGFQDGVEGDFMDVYKATYEDIAVDHIAYSRTVDDEPVMPALMAAFSRIGPFWFFVMVMSLFQCLVLFRFVSKYSPKSFQFLAAILFYFTFNMMLLQMKAMRQGLAIELMVLAFLLADRKNGIWFSLMIAVMAYYTHNSMLVVVPFYLLFCYITLRQQWRKKKQKRKRIIRINNRSVNKHEDKQKHVRRMQHAHIFARLWIIIRRWLKTHSLFPYVLLLAYFVLYIFKVTVLYEYMLPLMVLTGGEDSRLSGYAMQSNTAESLDTNLIDVPPLVVFYDAVIIFLVANYYKTAGPKMRVFCLISIAAAFGDMMFFGAGSFARMIMYYVVFNLAVYPAVARQLMKKYGWVGAAVFIVMLLGYAVKTSWPWITESEGERFATYRFVFMP